MDARIAAELLYESEATLRMVDTVLDDLQLGELEAPTQARGLWALRHDGDDPGGEFRAPTEFCVRGYWQVHELIDTLRQAREMMAPAGQQTELPLGPSSGDARLDSVISLVDALDSLDEPDGSARAEIVAALRREIHALLEGSRPSEDNDVRVRGAMSILSEAEARLTRLGHLFENGDHAA